MSQVDQVSSDLRFIRAAVEHRQIHRTPTVIALLWAGIIMAGGVWNDLSPLDSHLYWSIAPVIGFITSFVVGWSAGRRNGELDRQVGLRHGLHWSSIFLAGIALMILQWKLRLPGELIGQLAMLVAGLVYYLAGVHLDRRYVWPGIAMMLAASMVGLLSVYPWTIAGAVIALSLLVNFRNARQTS